MFIIFSGGLEIKKEDIKSVIEIESGSNDPMAYASILFLISFFKDQDSSVLGGVLFLIK